MINKKERVKLVSSSIIHAETECNEDLGVSLRQKILMGNAPTFVRTEFFSKRTERVQLAMSVLNSALLGLLKILFSH